MDVAASGDAAIRAHRSALLARWLGNDGGAPRPMFCARGTEPPQRLRRHAAMCLHAPNVLLSPLAGCAKLPNVEAAQQRSGKPAWADTRRKTVERRYLYSSWHPWRRPPLAPRPLGGALSPRLGCLSPANGEPRVLTASPLPCSRPRNNLQRPPRRRAPLALTRLECRDGCADRACESREGRSRGRRA